MDGGNYDLDNAYFNSNDTRENNHKQYRPHGLLAEPITESCYRHGDWTKKHTSSENEISLPFYWNDKVYLCMTKKTQSINQNTTQGNGGIIGNFLGLDDDSNAQNTGESLPAFFLKSSNISGGIFFLAIRTPLPWF